ncbi:hypothetical protein AQI70_36745 [Streptomyces curacoi]|uniref:Uncharacterized protein n=1 Tax=Streptomyces curacoi TaxID=146536 RepID=A0A117NTE3_9ACTN|nr:hypothetical protein AQI70_36745 [Streptomyces curacoi]
MPSVCRGSVRVPSVWQMSLARSPSVFCSRESGSRGNRAAAARRWCAILCRQFQDGLPGDLQSLKGLLRGGELLGEPGDLLGQSFDGLVYEALPGPDLVQELSHRRLLLAGGASRQVGVAVRVRRRSVTSLMDQWIIATELAGRVS